ncbi:MAG: hypothetical protein L0Z50_40310, partial [Verrucomicrobiales bacterium]|nr:hypothetical protein [Verrucomicrobiales bacterium]
MGAKDFDSGALTGPLPSTLKQPRQSAVRQTYAVGALNARPASALLSVASPPPDATPSNFPGSSRALSASYGDHTTRSGAIGGEVAFSSA